MFSAGEKKIALFAVLALVAGLQTACPGRQSSVVIINQTVDPIAPKAPQAREVCEVIHDAPPACGYEQSYGGVYWTCRTPKRCYWVTSSNTSIGIGSGTENSRAERIADRYGININGAEQIVNAFDVARSAKVSDAGATAALSAIGVDETFIGSIARGQVPGEEDIHQVAQIINASPASVQKLAIDAAAAFAQQPQQQQ